MCNWRSNAKIPRDGIAVIIRTVLALALVAIAACSEYIWSRQMGGTSTADAVVPSGITTDGSGSMIVVGTFYGTVNFGGGAVTSGGRGDVFLVKYSSTGAYQWARTFGEPGVASDQFGNAVATDANGNIFITGYYY